jgi:hypothetical protein
MSAVLETAETGELQRERELARRFWEEARIRWEMRDGDPIMVRVHDQKTGEPLASVELKTGDYIIWREQEKAFDKVWSKAGSVEEAKRLVEERLLLTPGLL